MFTNIKYEGRIGRRHFLTLASVRGAFPDRVDRIRP